MRISWKLINKELCKDHKNHGIQSVNNDGRSTANQQIVGDSFISIFQVCLSWLMKTFMQVTVLLKPLSITRIRFAILWNMHTKIRSLVLNVLVLPLKKLKI